MKELVTITITKVKDAGRAWLVSLYFDDETHNLNAAFTSLPLAKRYACSKVNRKAIRWKEQETDYWTQLSAEVRL